MHCKNRVFFFFFSSRRRHTRFDCDWSSDVCSSDLSPWHDDRMLFGKSHNLGRNYVNLPSGDFSSRLTSTLGHHGTPSCNMVTFDQLFAANRSMMYLQAGTCWGPLPCTSEILPMEPVLHPFCTGFRTFITRSLRNLTTSV